MFKYIIFSFFSIKKKREKNENVRLLANCFKKLKEQLKLKTKETDIMTKYTTYQEIKIKLQNHELNIIKRLFITLGRIRR